MSTSFTLVCTDCNHRLPEGKFSYLCPQCRQEHDSLIKGILKTEYPYRRIISSSNSGNLFRHLKTNHYLDLLPVCHQESKGPLKVGNTPMYHFEFQHPVNGKSFTFFLKDDAQNPTFSFKDRASQLVSAYARENGISTIAAASTGNAGSSLAGICASQQQKAIIFVPSSAPKAKLVQIVMYGAKLVVVDGNYDAAFNFSLAASMHFGWFNRNTAYNPFTIEGKKTVAFEIYDQLDESLPDIIFVPVGDGVIISGLYKGFEDLLQLGIISKIPAIVAVQSENSDNLVRNLHNKIFEMKPSATIADSIAVDYPRNFSMAKSYLNKYKGIGITVTDTEIIEAAALQARQTGIFAEPAAAAAMAGMIKYTTTKRTKRNMIMLVLSTGSGLKDIQTPLHNIILPSPLKPVTESLKKIET
jgi:threonine synthase